MTVALALLVAAACTAPVSLSTIRSDEARWLTSGPASYRIVVDIQRTDEQRRYRVTVQDGAIIDAELRYRDGRSWGEPQPLRDAQATVATVPGLYELIREELTSPVGRPVLVRLRSDPPYPARILIGEQGVGIGPVAVIVKELAVDLR